MIRSQAPNRFVRCLCRKRNDALLFSLAVFVALAPPTRGHAVRRQTRRATGKARSTRRRKT